MTTLRLFTFVSDREGGTYVEQIQAKSVKEAARVFGEKHGIFKSEFLGIDPVELDGFKNVWCETDVDGNDVFWLVNIVETVFPSEL